VPPINHSALISIIGSTRRAGIQQARKASVEAMNVKVIGSEALTP